MIREKKDRWCRETSKHTDFLKHKAAYSLKEVEYLTTRWKIQAVITPMEEEMGCL